MILHMLVISVPCWKKEGILFLRLPLLFFFLETEKEHACASGVGAEGERERILRRFQALGEPDAGLDPMTLGSSPEPKSRVGCSAASATQAPQKKSFKKM